MKILPALPFFFIYSLFYYIFHVGDTGRFIKKGVIFYIRNYLNLFTNIFLLGEMNGRFVFKFSDAFNNIKKRGVIVMVTLHFGIWEYLPVIFKRLGYRTGIMVSDYRSKLFKRVVEIIRKSRGIEFYRSIDQVKGDILLGFTLDNFNRKVLPIKGMKLSNVAFIISKRYGLPVFPVAAWREKGFFIVEVGERVNTLNEAFEWLRKRIELKPEQFLWIGK